MRCLWVVIMLGCLMALGAQEHPGKPAEHPGKPVEHPGKPAAKVTAEDIRKGIQAYINKDTQLKGGYFLIWDDQAKRPRVLQLVRVHEKLNKLTAAEYERLFKTKAPASEVYAVQALKAVKGVKEAKAVDEGVVVTLKPNETVRYGGLVAALQKAGITVRERVEGSQERQ